MALDPVGTSAHTSFLLVVIEPRLSMLQIRLLKSVIWSGSLNVEILAVNEAKLAKTLQIFWRCSKRKV